MAKKPEFSLLFIERTSLIAPDEWNKCAGNDNPFLSHAFFMALETSGSTTKENGWLTRHAVIKNAAGKIAAIMPAFIKTHSLGEYVFDHNWANAYEAAGGHYYPKYLSAIPFTPVGARKFLIDQSLIDAEKQAVIEMILEAPKALTRELGLSSFSANFIKKDEAELLANHGYLTRIDTQYHWQNNDYKTFDDFLATLTSRKRKTIKRERHDALNNGEHKLIIDIVTGDQINEKHWDCFYEFYISTSTHKWGRPYLTRQFFAEIGKTMAEKIVLIFAVREGNIIAGALNFIGKDTLFGRNWGASEHHPFLHFEVCYYQAIDFAIKNGLKTVEAGAQGEHKIARGYLPQKTYSAHWFQNQVFHDAVARYLEDERNAIESYIKNAGEFMPYKKT